MVISYDSVISFWYSLSGVTITGIVLGAILLVGVIVFDRLNRGIPNLKGFLFHTISNIVLLLFVLIGISFLSKTMFSVTTGSYTMAFGISSYSDILFSYATQYFYYSTSTWNNFISTYAPSVICMALIAILAIAVLFAFIQIFISFVSNFGKNQINHKPTYEILLGGFLLIIGILEITIGMVSGIMIYENYDISVVNGIVLIIMGVLVVGGTIVASVLRKKFRFYSITRRS